MLTLVALAWGCARHPPVVRPYPPPSADRLMAAWRAHQQAFTAMNARARATSWLGGDRVRATVLMLVDRAGRLRFEAEISLQGTVAVLATDGRRFGLLDLSHNELRRGPACPANVAALIRIPLAPAEVAAILLGDARIPDGTSAGAPSPGATRVDWDAHRGTEVLSVPRLDGWLRIWFERVAPPPGAGLGTADGVGDGRTVDASGWRILGATATSQDGKARWRVSYEDFSPVGPAAGSPHLEAPQIIRFAEGSASFDDGVEIKIKQRSFNAPADDSAFVLQPTAGVTAYDVGCP